MKLPLASLSLLLALSGGSLLRAEPPAADSAAQTQSSLSRDERQRLKAAQAAALKDPAVQAAKAKNDPDALQQAIRAAMLRRDPTLAALLEKAQPSSRDKSDEDRGSRYGFLTLGEKEQLRRAHSAAGKDPAVVAARKRLDAAATPEAKEKAEQALNDATGEAMQRIDPKVAPLLEKIRLRDQAAEKAGQ